MASQLATYDLAKEAILARRGTGADGLATNVSASFTAGLVAATAARSFLPVCCALPACVLPACSLFACPRRCAAAACSCPCPCSPALGWPRPAPTPYARVVRRGHACGPARGLPGSGAQRRRRWPVFGSRARPPERR